MGIPDEIDLDFTMYMYSDVVNCLIVRFQGLCMILSKDSICLCMPSGVVKPCLDSGLLNDLGTGDVFNM